MSPRAIELLFYLASSVIFGLLGFVPSTYQFLNDRAVIKLSDKAVHIFQVFFKFVCVSCLCMLIVNIARLAR